MKGYKVLPEHRTSGAETLEEVDLELHEQAVRVAVMLSNLLGQSWPPAIFARKKLPDRYAVPSLDESMSCRYYVTSNYCSAIHRDRNRGSAFAIALFLERHQPNCPKPDSTCRINWYFILPDLRRKIPLQHLLLLIWDSGTLGHGTCLDGWVSGGCHSDGLAIVSQSP